MTDLVLHATWSDPAQARDSLLHVVLPWCKQQMDAGRRLALEVRLDEDAKTDRQRRYYHGVVLKQIAQFAAPGGQRFDLATWKEHFRAEFLGFKTVSYVNPLTGKKSRRRVRISTEDLGVRAYNQLIEKVTAYAATELGVPFQNEWIDPETGEVFR